MVGEGLLLGGDVVRYQTKRRLLRRIDELTRQVNQIYAELKPYRDAERLAKLPPFPGEYAARCPKCRGQLSVIQDYWWHEDRLHWVCKRCGYDLTTKTADAPSDERTPRRTTINVSGNASVEIGQKIVDALAGEE